MNKDRVSRIRILALITLVFGIIWILQPVAALKVEGARIALDIEPGKTYTSPIGISISSEESEGTFAIDVMGFGQSLSDGTYIGLESGKDTSPYSARSLITVDRQTVHLLPGERAQVTATITVPSDTRDGGRYAIILIHPASAASGAPAAFATAVAIPVLLTVKNGAIRETGNISALEFTTANEGRDLTVSTTFANTGNYHYYGVVNTVTIADNQGSIVASNSTNPFARAIIPGGEVRFQIGLDANLPDGMYTITSRMEQQDGTLLDEKKEPYQAGESPSESESPSMTSSPGFGGELGVVAILFCLLSLFRMRKWRK